MVPLLCWCVWQRSYEEQPCEPSSLSCAQPLAGRADLADDLAFALRRFAGISCHVSLLWTVGIVAQKLFRASTCKYVLGLSTSPCESLMRLVRATEVWYATYHHLRWQNNCIKRFIQWPCNTYTNWCPLLNPAGALIPQTRSTAGAAPLLMAGITDD